MDIPRSKMEMLSIDTSVSYQDTYTRPKQLSSNKNNYKNKKEQFVIGIDDQISDSNNPEHNLTNTFICTKISHDDYVTHSLNFRLEVIDCSYFLNKLR